MVKLSYFLKEKNLRMRDFLYKEGDLVEGIYFIREGEFQISIKYKDH